jgi:ATP-dependent DNA ligase
MISYFYPPQPSRIWPNQPVFRSLAKNPLWDAEIKYNGWRILLFILDKIYIYNRHGTIIAIDHSLFENLFADIPPNTVFDGELIDKRTKSLKNIMVFFDVPFYDGKNLQSLPLKERRHYLEQHFAIAPSKFAVSKIARVYRTQQFTSHIIELYNEIESRQNDLEEGLVLKNINSKYRSHPSRGIDVLDWIKVKKIGDHAHVTRS